MAKTEVRGKELLVKRPPVMIFSMFNDLSLFTSNLPDQYKDQVVATPDSLTFSYNGINLGVVIDERVPFSLVSLKDDGLSPLKFNLRFIMTPVGLDSTLFHIEIDTEMNVMLKMMLGNKLQDVVDAMTDQIDNVVNNGAMPDMDSFKKEYFS